MTTLISLVIFFVSMCVTICVVYYRLISTQRDLASAKNLLINCRKDKELASLSIFEFTALTITQALNSYVLSYPTYTLLAQDMGEGKYHFVFTLVSKKDNKGIFTIVVHRVLENDVYVTSVECAQGTQHYRIQENYYVNGRSRSFDVYDLLGIMDKLLEEYDSEKSKGAYTT